MNAMMVGRFYFRGEKEDRVILNIPGTSYQIAVPASGQVVPSPQGRVRGVLRLPVWKLDVVTAGGAYIEPAYGKPRRVQGKIIGSVTETNSVVVAVCGQPIVGDLPPRWTAAHFQIGSRVGLDISIGGQFVPLDAVANLEPDLASVPVVNLSAG